MQGHDRQLREGDREAALEPTTERYDASFSRSGCQPVTTVCLSGRTVVAFAERFHGATARTRLTG